MLFHVDVVLDTWHGAHAIAETFVYAVARTLLFLFLFSTVILTRLYLASLPPLFLVKGSITVPTPTGVQFTRQLKRHGTAGQSTATGAGDAGKYIFGGKW